MLLQRISTLWSIHIINILIDFTLMYSFCNAKVYISNRVKLGSIGLIINK